MPSSALARLLFFCGVCQAACYAGMLAISPLSRNIPAFFVLWFAAFSFYGLSVWFVFKKDASGCGTRSALLTLAAFALLFRALLWLSPASLSDDIYRNVWEGRMAVAGVNPYQYAPDDPYLSAHRDAAVYPHINHPQHSAIYPPISQFVFGLAARLHPSAEALKAVLTLFDLGSAAVVLLILCELGIPGRRFIVYAWHPLPIIEFAGSGHCDSIGIFFLLLGALFVLRGFQYAGVGALILGALAKVYPVLFVPLVLLKRPGAVAVCLICGAIACVPFMDAGAGFFSSLFVYARDWYFNGSLYDVLALCLGDRMAARAVAGFLFAACYAFFVWKCMRDSKTHAQLALPASMLMVIGALLLLSPVVYPWYLCWLLPFLAVFPNRAWLLLSALIVISYQVLIQYTQTGVWQERLWVRLVQYVPFYALLLYDGLRARRVLPVRGSA